MGDAVEGQHSTSTTFSINARVGWNEGAARRIGAMTNGVNCPNRLARRRRRVYLLPPAEGDRKFPHGSAVFLTSCLCFTAAL